MAKQQFLLIGLQFEFFPQRIWRCETPSGTTPMGGTLPWDKRPNERNNYSLLFVSCLFWDFDLWILTSDINILLNFFFSFSFVSSMWSLCKWYFLGRVFISLRKKPFCLVYLILITPNFLKKNIEETINITYQPNTCWANVKEKSSIKNASRSRFMKRLISDNNFLDCFFL